MTNTWKDPELSILKDNYLGKSLQELVDLTGRTERGITQRLVKLAKENPNEWDKRRIRTLHGKCQRKYRGVDPEEYNPNIKWTDRDKKLLKDSYLHSSPGELEKIIGRGKWGIIQKLKKLAEDNPRDWSIKRINYLYARQHEEYMQTYTGPVEGWGTKKLQYMARTEAIRQRELVAEIRNQILRKDIKWTKTDIIVLANTYFTHDWLGLAKIFRAKEVGFDIKLRELVQQEPDAWDNERIEELEHESEKYSWKEIRERLGYYRPARWKHDRPRRPEIDRLIEQGLNLRQIGMAVGISRQAVWGYISSRGLGDFYFSQKTRTPPSHNKR